MYYSLWVTFENCVGCLMAIYTQKKPEYNYRALLKSIITKAILVPMLFWLPMILWEVLKIGVKRLVGGRIGQYFFEKKEGTNTGDLSDTDKVKLQQHTIIAHDDTRLDTLEITPVSIDHTDSKYKKYIIYFTDKKVLYEDTIEALKSDAIEFQSNVIGFNYRGVGKSTGCPTSSYDFVIDGIAEVEWLLERGISSENITLRGHSLGGGVAVLVAHHFHQQNKPINVFNDRSFSTITNVIVGTIRGGNKETLGKKLLGWLAKPFIKFALSLTQWEIDADDAFKQIPDGYRDYIVVRSPKLSIGTQCISREDVIDDQLITTYASMHAALKGARGVEKAKLDKIASESDRLATNGSPFLVDNLNAAGVALKKARDSYKNRKMMPQDLKTDGHAVPLSLLINSRGNTAQSFFGEFLERANVDHGVREQLSN